MRIRAAEARAKIAKDRARAAEERLAEVSEDARRVPELLASAEALHAELESYRSAPRLPKSYTADEFSALSDDARRKARSRDIR